MTPDFVAALYEAALEPEGLRGLIRLVGGYLGADGTAASLVEECLLSDAAPNPEFAGSQRDYVDQTDDDNDCDGDVLTTPGGSSGHVVNWGATPVIQHKRAKVNRFQDDPRSLHAILPHLRRALQLRARGQQASAAQSLAMAAMTFGAVICDGAGRVAHVNPAAEMLASRRIGIAFKSRDRLITSIVPADATKLAMLIHAAATQHQPGSIVLTGRDGSNGLMVLVTSLQAQQGVRPGQVLLALRQIGGAPSFGARRLSELFRLSPAQAGLAIGLYEGKSFEEIAFERGVKVTTLRTHFAEVLSRTGSRSLRELMRLLGSIPPLL